MVDDNTTCEICKKWPGDVYPTAVVCLMCKAWMKARLADTEEWLEETGKRLAEAEAAHAEATAQRGALRHCLSRVDGLTEAEAEAVAAEGLGFLEYVTDRT